MMLSRVPPLRLTHSIRTANSLFDFLPSSSGACWLLRTTMAADVVVVWGGTGARKNKLADHGAVGGKLNIDLATCNQIHAHDRIEINSSVCVRCLR